MEEHKMSVRINVVRRASFWYVQVLAQHEGQTHELLSGGFLKKTEAVEAAETARKALMDYGKQAGITVKSRRDGELP